MAFAAVQTATNSSTTAQVVVTINATAKNNLLVIGVRPQGGATVTSITSNVSETYVIGTSVSASGRIIYQSYGVQVTGGSTTVTVDFNTGNAGGHYVTVDEYSGTALTNAAAFDVRTSGTGTSTTPAVSTLTPAATGELIVAHAVGSQSMTWTAGTNYTKYAEAGAASIVSEYRLSGDTTETAPFTASGFATWAEIASAFKPEPTLKTWDGLAKASIKTFNGLAIASVKRVNNIPL